MEMYEKPCTDRSEEIKMVHSQHARIMKEEDEIWISSEDLNTENSSDDERLKLRHACKRKTKVKNRKRSSPNINVQRPSISSIPPVAGTSKDLDDRLLASRLEVPSSQLDESKTSDEEYAPVPSNYNTKRMSLEDWRPMKGALNLTSLEEAAAENRVPKMSYPENFYEGLLDKLRSLKSCSSLKSLRKISPPERATAPVDGKSFQFLKNTPEVKATLDFINKLDEEIADTICKYKTERSERHKTELELCQHISDNALSQDKDTDLFLDMCNFEGKLKGFKKQAEEEVMEAFTKGQTRRFPKNEEIQSNNPVENKVENAGNGDNSAPRNFIELNKRSIRDPMMTTCCLTDEEKTKIENMLKDIDDFQLDDGQLSVWSDSIKDVNELEENKENMIVDLTTNAFSILQNEKDRMDEINTQLQRITLEKGDAEEAHSNSRTTINPVKDEEFWKKCILDQSLKDIDEKLAKIHQSNVEAEEKLKFFLENNNIEEEEDIILI
ncbi:uncharacterized protein LOC115887217 [Sitophilus oryzae]|uniref:Uncharacterized protein LOC115887217 n=1 Tax=Sitophilus oryzae TaxID=7048 RepID=A0A6J2YH54_SITOR|nr:uncharacterized protein LOC115887217 [Sitophilus oryzae]